MPSSLSREIKRLTRRGLWIHKQSGIKELVVRGARKTTVYATLPVQRAFAKHRTFQFDGSSLAYIIHPYNATWRSERAVEIAIARHFLKDRDAARGAEIGNVLSYYLKSDHEVVDKYERALGVLNVDVVDYQPDQPLSWIVAVSTLEHVGWDETPREAPKVRAAIAHLRTLLAPDGILLVTCPRGYNAYLTDAIDNGELQPTREYFFTRSGTWRWSWREERREEAMRHPAIFDFDRGRALHIWVAEFAAASSS